MIDHDDQAVILDLNREGALSLLAFLESHRDDSATTQQQIAARDSMIYLLKNRLYPYLLAETVFGEVAT
jgi:hypothetical protein